MKDNHIIFNDRSPSRNEEIWVSSPLPSTAMSPHSTQILLLIKIQSFYVRNRLVSGVSSMNHIRSSGPVSVRGTG